MEKVQLVNSEEMALVDNEDYERIKHRNWQLTEDRKVISYNGDSKTGVFLHYAVMNVPRNDTHIVAAVNRNYLNCQKKNLRVINPQTSLLFQGPNDRNQTGFKGVCVLTTINGKKRYCAKLKNSSFKIDLKSTNYDTPEEAAILYDNWIRKYFPDLIDKGIYLNFKDEVKEITKPKEEKEEMLEALKQKEVKEEKFYTTTELANIVGVGLSTIPSWVAQGKIKASKKIGHSVIYSQETLDFIQQNISPTNQLLVDKNRIPLKENKKATKKIDYPITENYFCSECHKVSHIKKPSSKDIKGINEALFNLLNIGWIAQPHILCSECVPKKIRDVRPGELHTRTKSLALNTTQEVYDMISKLAEREDVKLTYVVHALLYPMVDIPLEEIVIN